MAVAAAVYVAVVVAIRIVNSIVDIVHIVVVLVLVDNNNDDHTHDNDNDIDDIVPHVPYQPQSLLHSYKLDADDNDDDGGDDKVVVVVSTTTSIGLFVLVLLTLLNLVLCSRFSFPLSTARTNKSGMGSIPMIYNCPPGFNNLVSVPIITSCWKGLNASMAPIK